MITYNGTNRKREEERLLQKIDTSVKIYPSKWTLIADTNFDDFFHIVSDSNNLQQVRIYLKIQLDKVLTKNTSIDDTDLNGLKYLKIKRSNSKSIDNPSHQTIPQHKASYAENPPLDGIPPPPPPPPPEQLIPKQTIVAGDIYCDPLMYSERHVMIMVSQDEYRPIFYKFVHGVCKYFFLKESRLYPVEFDTNTSLQLFLSVDGITNILKLKHKGQILMFHVHATTLYVYSADGISIANVELPLN